MLYRSRASQGQKKWAFPTSKTMRLMAFSSNPTSSCWTRGQKCFSKGRHRGCSGWWGQRKPSEGSVIRHASFLVTFYAVQKTLRVVYAILEVGCGLEDFPFSAFLELSCAYLGDDADVETCFQIWGKAGGINFGNHHSSVREPMVCMQRLQ